MATMGAFVVAEWLHGSAQLGATDSFQSASQRCTDVFRWTLEQVAPGCTMFEDGHVY
jgi:hypothetical protein